MTSAERIKYIALLGLRAMISLIDVLGIFAIGFLATSIALFITLGSDPTRVIDLGSFTIPAVTASTLPIIATAIICLFIFKGVFSIVLTRALAYFLANVEARAARIVADRAFGHGLEESRMQSRDDVGYAVQAGSPAAFNAILNAIGTLAAEGLLFLFVVASFIVVDPISALGAVLYFGCVAFFIHLAVGKRIRTAAVNVTKGYKAASEAINDLSDVLREATVMSRKDFFFDRIYEARSRSASSLAAQHTLSGMPRYIVETALMLAVGSFILWQASQSNLIAAAGTTGIFLSGGLRLTAALLPLQGAILTIIQSIPAANFALELLNQSAPNYERVSQVAAVNSSDSKPIKVTFEDVSLRFQANKADSIKGINLVIQPGMQVAFIGPSGAGKTSIADLILGLLSPSSGEVRLQGLTPREYIKNWPGQVAYVAQQPGIVSGTIADNVALGIAPEEREQAKLDQAFQAAHLGKLLESLPNGQNHDLGKRRDELSGGQLQRIGIARALYSSPKLLIMDEATSALDAESENEINRALDEMRGKVTVILIAHRLNTIQKSDLVYLVEDGQISASGTFPELLKQNSKVQQLATLMSINPSE